jgi:TM2 domain-containing membrane protein YozV
MEDLKSSNEKKLTVLLLWLLVGIFSVHRFYTGKSLSGTLQVLNFCLMILLIHYKVRPFLAFSSLLFVGWWALDVLLIIMGKFTDKEGRPIIDWV